MTPIALRQHLPADQIEQLRQLADQERSATLAGHFAADPQRFAAFSRQHAGILYDFSKNRLRRDTLAALLRLAESRQLRQRLEDMFRGAAINESETRPALHSWLRGGGEPQHPLLGEMRREQARLLAFVEDVHSGRYAGASGAAFTDVISIGIGGSLLGPHMVTRALKRHAQSPLRFHFISDPDGTQLADRLPQLDPARTLVLVISKSFTTSETLRNAERARAWLVEQLGETAGTRQFIGVSAAPEKMRAFGIAPERQFPMWDSVGGRFSVWSAVGLAPALALGSDGFRAFLNGAHDIDEHVRNTPLADNLAALFALSHFWHHSFLGIPTVVNLPYHPRLRLLPPYLQQLEMESLGKGVDSAHQPLQKATGAIVFGQVGVNAQHSFMQLLHQGPEGFLVDFVAVASDADTPESLALASCLAQSRALMLGTGDTTTDSWRVCPGNRPSNTLLLPALTPFTLGQLLALYEHKVYIQSVLWNINPFDQWGVELGKTLALEVEAQLRGEHAHSLDASTDGLLAHIRRLRG